MRSYMVRGKRVVIEPSECGFNYNLLDEFVKNSIEIDYEGHVFDVIVIYWVAGWPHHKAYLLDRREWV